ncbi:MAG: carboxypeptidase regulatory-like domain-containing protein [Polyangiales bacterium]
MRRAFIAVALLVGCKESPPTLTGPASSASGIPEEKPPVSVAPSNLPSEPDKDRYPLSDDQIAKIVNPTGATEYSGPTGVIEGVIKVKGDPSPMRTFMALPKGCESSSAVHAPIYRAGPKGELADTLVAVLKVPGYVRPSKDDKKVFIKNCSIDPTVIDLSLGQRLMVGNTDTMPYTPQIPAKMLVRRVVIKDMSPVPLFLTQPGAFGMTWLAGAMPGAAVPTATIFVLPSALHTVTGTDGKFRITGIPAGKVTVAASHLDMDEVQKEVEVKAGAEAKVELTLTYKAPPSAAAPSTSGSAKPVPSIR